ncbi:MAG: thiamine diphosphokinase [Eubacteriales bacterium]|nr:thiamine diphosphokinase [Eubacteriales bacterium]
MKRCVILGAGELLTRPVPVRSEDYVIAADGGYRHCRRLGIVPDLILGDFDSVQEEEAGQIARIRQISPDSVTVLPVEKDDTDMLAAIRAGLSEGYREFYIYGGEGGRLEHTIANLQCLVFLKEQGAKGYLMGEKNTVFIIRDETVWFEERATGYLSLFSMGERAEGVTIRRMKYELADAVLTNSYPIGISNEFMGQRASVTVRRGTLLAILSEKD